jgi:hypothetical protein
MDPVNLAFEVPAGAGRLIVWVIRGIVWVVRVLYEYPMIGIPLGILLICGLIFVVVRIVQMRRGKI